MGWNFRNFTSLCSKKRTYSKKIIPELKKGTCIICDRFVYSTEAYQGAGHGVSFDLLKTLKKTICENLVPDITFIFDQEVEKSIQRIKDRNDNNRYENFDLSFHERVRQYFKSIQKSKYDNCILINADDTIDNISKEIILYIKQKLIPNLK